MHRNYRPVRPAQSRLLQQKWDKAYYDEHRRRLQMVRPQIDTRPPQTYMHLHLKMKKLQLEEERLATVERDNRILLEKMAYIMRTSRNGDNKNEYERKSLNRERRIRELLRIAEENQQILKRIESTRPKYDHVQWEREWQANLQLMDQLSAYPPEWWKYQEQSRSSSRSPTRQDGKSKQNSARGRDNRATSHRDKADANSKNNSNSCAQDKSKKPSDKASSPEQK